MSPTMIIVWFPIVLSSAEVCNATEFIAAKTLENYIFIVSSFSATNIEADGLFAPGLQLAWPLFVCRLKGISTYEMIGVCMYLDYELYQESIRLVS